MTTPVLDAWTSPDGTPVRIRPITAADFELEFEFVRGLSPVTGYQRLLSGRRLTRAEIERFANVDGECEVALIATLEHEGRERQVGVARFVREDCGDSAEFAMVVADAWQGRGLGRRLLELLVDEARSRGLRRLHGETLSDNAGMIGLARRLGFEIARSPASATITLVTVSTLTAPRTSMDDWLDPILDTSFKGWPHGSPPLRRSQVAAQGWNVMDGDLPLPVAVLHRAALAHDIAWMQRFAVAAGVGLAPHGKTTMSPQLLRRQLEAGAWGLTFANVSQMQVGLAAGARNVLVANQVLAAADLASIAARREADPGLRVLFLLDSAAQLDLIESTSPGLPFEVLLEVGLPGGRTGVRGHDEAMALARRAAASAAVTLAGIECYEGLGVAGDDAVDRAQVDALFDRVDRIARACDAEGLFENDAVIVSAGGSAVFDLVAQRLKPALGRPAQGLLRSGCYVTHDQGHYRRFVQAVDRRLGCAEGDGLRAALEVWTLVQSMPERGLAILAAGKRDVSFDLGMPIPLAVMPRATRERVPVPAHWRIAALNDQHAYLRLHEGTGPAGGGPALAVGDRIVLGLSHPCTTFDKWRWMPVIEDDGRVVDAITTLF